MNGLKFYGRLVSRHLGLSSRTDRTTRTIYLKVIDNVTYPTSWLTYVLAENCNVYTLLVATNKREHELMSLAYNYTYGWLKRLN